MQACASLLQEMQGALQSQGYTVQTCRIATNPFGEWIHPHDPTTVASIVASTIASTASGAITSSSSTAHQLQNLERLNQLLAQHSIEFCSVGPAQTADELDLCVDIVSLSHRFSCSVNIPDSNHTSNAQESSVVAPSAQHAADTILKISQRDHPTHMQGGLGNFRFCTASQCPPGIPFFPAAKAQSIVQAKAKTKGNATATADDNTSTTFPLQFAIGLENGPVLHQLLKDCGTIANLVVSSSSSASSSFTQFQTHYTQLLEPIQTIAQSIALQHNATYLGIDTSWNPSLDPHTGSIAAAVEQLQEIPVFGGPGTVAAASAMTRAIQSLPSHIQRTGYCGLMLPVCEDTRLAELATTTTGTSSDKRTLRISDLLSISSVCGVGVDTVPVPGDVSRDVLASLILDVAGIAGRWNKSLSCRVFPVPGKKAGEFTTFDSPYMINTSIFDL